MSDEPKAHKVGFLSQIVGLIGRQDIRWFYFLPLGRHAALSILSTLNDYHYVSLSRQLPA